MQVRQIASSDMAKIDCWFNEALRTATFATLCGGLLLLNPVLASPEQRMESGNSCSHCGDYLIFRSAPAAALVGSKLRISESVIEIPGCGEFSYSIEPGDNSMLLLQRQRFDDYCDSKSGDSYAVVLKESSYFSDNKAAVFSLIDRESKRELLNVEAAHLGRGHPCDSGMERGSLICALTSKANLIRNLSEEVRDLPPFASRKINVVTISGRAESDCWKREASSGGGQWPQVWADICITGILRAKLGEVLAWKRCTSETRIPPKLTGKAYELEVAKKCPFPKSNFKFSMEKTSAEGG